MREKYLLSLAASMILVSFVIIVYFVTTGIVENKSSEDESITKFQDLYYDTSDIIQTTKNKTQTELKQFLNFTKDSINKNQQIKKFQQLIENTVGKNKNNTEN